MHVRKHRGPRREGDRVCSLEEKISSMMSECFLQLLKAFNCTHDMHCLEGHLLADY
ncbi:hypothetical protein C1H46_045042 [Malus baccata]|uniref:Uncharacterized protein n=1 Tax=Malus baccata TaxID=106549 RepID=A0A540K5B6_MALBA|nr:hypothetical protein C1H46_045042 [Malus baccata]